MLAWRPGRPYPEAMTSRRKMSALAAQLEELPDLHGVELALRTKTLKDALVKVLTEEGDRGIHEALHRGNTTGEQVAEQLDTNVRTLHNRSSRHIATLKGKEGRK